MCETVEIVRMACRGEKLAYDGDRFTLPRLGGQGKWPVAPPSAPRWT